MTEKLYAERDAMEMDIAGNFYCQHVSAMTRERLHSKADIAAELGWRDWEIAKLQEQVKALTWQRESALIECAAAKIAIQYIQAGKTEFTLNTPKTDAFIADLKAQGVDEFSKHPALQLLSCSHIATEFAAQLRAKPAEAGDE